MHKIFNNYSLLTQSSINLNTPSSSEEKIIFLSQSSEPPLATICRKSERAHLFQKLVLAGVIDPYGIVESDPIIEMTQEELHCILIELDLDLSSIRTQIQTEKIERKAFDLLITKTSYIQRFLQQFGIDEKPIFPFGLSASSFTQGQLYISLDVLLKRTVISSPQSRQKNVAQGLVDIILGSIYLEEKTNIQEDDWFYYVQLLIRGNYVMQEQIDSIEEALFNSAFKGEETIEITLLNWIPLHLFDPLEKFCFVIQAATLLEKKFSKSEVNRIVHFLFASMDLITKNTNAHLLIQWLQSELYSFQLISSFLKVTAFLNGFNLSPFTRVEIRGFNQLVFCLNFDSYTVQFPQPDADDLEKLLKLDNPDPFSDLFLSYHCTPTDVSKYAELLNTELDDNFDALIPRPLFVYFKLLYAIQFKGLAQVQQHMWIQKCFVEILPLIQKKDEIKKWLETTLNYTFSKDSILQDWISYLFNHHFSKEGFELWNKNKKIVSEDFSKKLISNQMKSNLDLGLQMLHQVTLSNFVIVQIIRCTALLQSQSNVSSTNLKIMSTLLMQQLKHKDFQPIKTVKIRQALSQCLLWLSIHLEDKALMKELLNLNFFEGGYAIKARELKEELDLLPIQPMSPPTSVKAKFASIVQLYEKKEVSLLWCIYVLSEYHTYGLKYGCKLDTRFLFQLLQAIDWNQKVPKKVSKSLFTFLFTLLKASTSSEISSIKGEIERVFSNGSHLISKDDYQMLFQVSYKHRLKIVSPEIKSLFIQGLSESIEKNIIDLNDLEKLILFFEKNQLSSELSFSKSALEIVEKTLSTRPLLACDLLMQIDFTNTFIKDRLINVIKHLILAYDKLNLKNVLSLLDKLVLQDEERAYLLNPELLHLCEKLLSSIKNNKQDQENIFELKNWFINSPFLKNEKQHPIFAPLACKFIKNILNNTDSNKSTQSIFQLICRFMNCITIFEKSEWDSIFDTIAQNNPDSAYLLIQKIEENKIFKDNKDYASIYGTLLLNIRDTRSTILFLEEIATHKEKFRPYFSSLIFFQGIGCLLGEASKLPTSKLKSQINNMIAIYDLVNHAYPKLCETENTSYLLHARTTILLSMINAFFSAKKSQEIQFLEQLLLEDINWEPLLGNALFYLEQTGSQHRNAIINKLFSKLPLTLGRITFPENANLKKIFNFLLDSLLNDNAIDSIQHGLKIIQIWESHLSVNAADPSYWSIGYTLLETLFKNKINRENFALLSETIDRMFYNPSYKYREFFNPFLQLKLSSDIYKLKQFSLEEKELFKITNILNEIMNNLSKISPNEIKTILNITSLGIIALAYQSGNLYKEYTKKFFNRLDVQIQRKSDEPLCGNKFGRRLLFLNRVLDELHTISSQSPTSPEVASLLMDTIDEYFEGLAASVQTTEESQELVKFTQTYSQRLLQINRK